MSPGLFKKYYAAAEHVGDHAVLTTEGLRFAPHPAVAFADRQKLYEQQIISSTSRTRSITRSTSPRCGCTSTGPDGQAATVEQWATDGGLSPKYARLTVGRAEGKADDKFFIGVAARPVELAPRAEATGRAGSERRRDGIRSSPPTSRSSARELAPKETPPIVPDAGNGPIDHLARRRKTAEARDTFDPANLAKLSVAIPNLPDVPAAGDQDVLASGEAFCRLFPNRFFYVDRRAASPPASTSSKGSSATTGRCASRVLSDAENAELDRLWGELYFVTGIWEKMLRGFVFFERSERNFLKHPDFDSFKEEDPELVKDETLARFKEVYLQAVEREADRRRTREAPDQHLLRGRARRAEVAGRDAEAGASRMYLKDLLAFAERAYRRPLTDAEQQKLEKFYADVCRDKDHGTEAAVRATIVAHARVAALLRCASTRPRRAIRSRRCRTSRWRRG